MRLLMFEGDIADILLREPVVVWSDCISRAPQVQLAAGLLLLLT